MEVWYSRYRGVANFILEAYFEAGLPVREIVRQTSLYQDTVYKLRKDYRSFGQLYPPQSVKLGRPRLLTTEQEERLLDYLSDRPTAYLDELSWFCADEFNIAVGESTIRSVLKRQRWLRKIAKKRALK